MCAKTVDSSALCKDGHRRASSSSKEQTFLISPASCESVIHSSVKIRWIPAGVNVSVLFFFIYHHHDQLANCSVCTSPQPSPPWPWVWWQEIDGIDGRLSVIACVCVCVSDLEKEREKNNNIAQNLNGEIELNLILNKRLENKKKPGEDTNTVTQFFFMGDLYILIYLKTFHKMFSHKKICALRQQLQNSEEALNWVV